MKRHESIAPLSRDHHSSLILAQLLKKNAPMYRDLPISVKDKAAYATQQFDEHIKKHFEQEELMFAKLVGIHPEIDSGAALVKTEHRELRLIFEGLPENVNLEGVLDSLGCKLEEHIRMEERILFPLLQEHCSEEVLQEIHALLH